MDNEITLVDTAPVIPSELDQLLTLNDKIRELETELNTRNTRISTLEATNAIRSAKLDKLTEMMDSQLGFLVDALGSHQGFIDMIGETVMEKIEGRDFERTISDLVDSAIENTDLDSAVGTALENLSIEIRVR